MHNFNLLYLFIALDPAGPIFNDIDRPDKRALDPTDALFVDAIHTSGGEVGFGSHSPQGHVDFYPNGGLHPQPGCPEFNGSKKQIPTKIFL